MQHPYNCIIMTDEQQARANAAFINAISVKNKAEDALFYASNKITSKPAYLFDSEAWERKVKSQELCNKMYEAMQKTDGCPVDEKQYF